MADLPISGLPSADALVGTESIPVVQGGVTKRTTPQAILVQLRSDLAAPTGGQLVTALPAGAGAVPRDLQAKLRDFPSVRDFGATADGITDDLAAFNKAVAAAASAVLDTQSTVTVSQVCRVHVPAGTYVLSDLVSGLGKSVDWHLDDGAVITNVDNLGGRVIRGGAMRLARKQHYGSFDTACTFSATANYSSKEPPAVAGLALETQLPTYASRDSVAVYIANTSPPYIATLVAPNYTSTTVTCPTHVDVRKLFVGMVVDTAHSPKWSGFITSWAADGSSITVSAWYQFGGAAGTPANGVNAFVAPVTKVWSQNSGVTLGASSPATAATGYEMDVYNYKGSSNPYQAVATGQTWGFDCYAVSSINSCSAAYVARGYWSGCYISESALNTSTGFVTKGAELNGFSYESPITTGTAFRALYSGSVSFSLTNAGIMKLGRADAASTPEVQFRSNTLSPNYDTRIRSSGGTSADSAGTLGYWAANHNFNGAVNPTTDTAITALQINKTTYVSGASFMASFSLNGGLIGSISGNGSTTTYSTTSDYRLKQNVKPLQGAWARIQQCRPCEYEFKAQPGEVVRGFIAHELQEVCPQAVVGMKDEVDAEGSPVFQSIDPGKLIADLTAALQEAMRRIEVLEGKA